MIISWHGSSLQPGRNPVYRIVIAQLIWTLIAASSLSIFNWIAAYSSLLGGLACVVPNGYLAIRLGRTGQSGTRGSPGWQLIWAEAGKWALTVAVFTMIFVLVDPLDVIVFFSTFVGVQLVHFLMPLFWKG